MQKCLQVRFIIANHIDTRNLNAAKISLCYWFSMTYENGQWNMRKCINYTNVTHDQASIPCTNDTPGYHYHRIRRSPQTDPPHSGEPYSGVPCSEPQRPGNHFVWFLAMSYHLRWNVVIDPNIVALGFYCKLYIFDNIVMTSIFMISSPGCHPRWLTVWQMIKIATKGYFHLNCKVYFFKVFKTSCVTNIEGWALWTYKKCQGISIILGKHKCITIIKQLRYLYESPTITVGQIVNHLSFPYGSEKFT